MTTIRAKSEDLPRLIVEAKGWEYVTFRGEVTLLETKVIFQPHTPEGSHQALQLLCEMDRSRILTATKIGFIHVDDVISFNHDNTPESICQAICLAFLASNGVHVELIEE